MSAFSFLPTTHTGLKTYEIPKAGADGVPVGRNPHKAYRRPVVIQPDRAGGHELDLASLDADTIQAMQLPQISGESLDTMREIGYLGYSKMIDAAAAPQAQYADVPEKSAAMSVGQPYGQPAAQVSPGLGKLRRVSPLSGKNTVNTQVDTVPIPTVQAAPTKMVQVVFEIHGYGRVVSAVSDVIVEDNFIVLVYDTKAENQPFIPSPPDEDEASPIFAMNLVGTKLVYRVQATDVHYVMEDGTGHCVLWVAEIGELS